MPLAVNEQSAEVKRLAEQWTVLEALQGGTPAMRAAGKAFLPQWPNEEAASYSARLATATLFPAYRRTVGVMASKPFSEKLALSEDAPASIVQWAEDIDRQGVSLHSFAAEMFNETVGYGLAGVLVEYPAVRKEPGKIETVAQVEAAGRRPYFVRVMHSQILGWQSETVDGEVRLTQLRLLESYEEKDGRFGTTSKPQVRVLEPGKWEVWRQKPNTKGNSEHDWEMFEEGVTSLKKIPFVPFYGIRDGFMCGKPALEDLAHLNVEHWQSKSDQQTILHVARVPILAMIGAEDETALTVGAMAAVKLPQDADLKFVEHSGAAIEAGRNSLVDLVEEMVQTGAELLVKKPSGQRTASQDNNEQEGNKCDLQRMAENFADALDQALQFMADYARLTNAGTVSLFDDYGAANLSDASAVLLKDLQMAGLLSKKTVLKELQRRGVLSSDLDVDGELANAEADGPPLGTMVDLMKIGASDPNANG